MYNMLIGMVSYAILNNIYIITYVLPNIMRPYAFTSIIIALPLYFFFNQKRDNSDQIDLTTTSQSGGTSVAQNTSMPLATAPLPRTKPTPTKPSPISQPQDTSVRQDTSTTSATVPELRGITPQLVQTWRRDADIEYMDAYLSATGLSDALFRTAYSQAPEKRWSASSRGSRI